MRGQLADTNLFAFLANVSEVADAADVDQQLRLGQTQFHRRNQAVATRENLRAIRVLGQQANGFRNRLRSQVIKCCGYHKYLLCGSAPAERSGDGALVLRSEISNLKSHLS